MKRILVICCILVMLFSASMSACAADEQTEFDRFADGDVITIQKGYYKENRSIQKIAKAGQKEMFQTVIKAWCNLLQYEVKQGADVNDTMAAEIYRCFANGYANGAFCATSPDSKRINVIFGTSPKNDNSRINMYWLEWDIGTQVIRASKKEIDASSPIKSDQDILNNATFKSYAQSAYMDWLTMNPVQTWWDSRSDFVKYMDKLYSKANKGKKPGIK